MQYPHNEYSTGPLLANNKMATCANFEEISVYSLQALRNRIAFGNVVYLRSDIADVLLGLMCAPSPRRVVGYVL